jgi:hypothetical protein
MTDFSPGGGAVQSRSTLFEAAKSWTRYKASLEQSRQVSTTKGAQRQRVRNSPEALTPSPVQHRNT